MQQDSTETARDSARNARQAPGCGVVASCVWSNV